MKKVLPNCNINMTVLNDDDFLSPYSPTETPVIASDVAEFLEQGAVNYLPKQQVQLNVHSNCIDDNEKVIYDKAIRNYFNVTLDEVQKDMQRNLIISVIFTIIGIVGLALMFLLDHFDVNGIWVEVVDIFAWVFVWEAVDQFFIERRKMLLDCRKYKAMANMQINYHQLANGK